MSFHHYSSNSLERLHEALLSLAPPCAFDEEGWPEARPDPFALESFVTPSPGIQRWLTQELSHTRGVFANGRFQHAEGFLEKLCDALVPHAHSSAWQARSLLWPIAEVLREVVLLPKEDLSTSQRELSEWLERNRIEVHAGALPDQLMQLAFRIGEAFHRYSLYRIDLVNAWEAGSDEESPWQAALWRLLSTRIQAPHPGRRLEALRALLEGPSTKSLRLTLQRQVGSRLVLFGIHTLAPSYIQSFAALSRHCDIHLFHLLPGLPLEPSQERAHPLRQSFGRLSDELSLLLDTYLPERQRHLLFVPPPRAHHQPLLKRLQSALFQPLSHQAEEPSLGAWGADDNSLRFIACSSPLRQVEVLRDNLLSLLTQDPTLQPRDILILTPNLETYAPLLDAVLRDGDTYQTNREAGFPALHYRQNLTARRANPLAEAFLAILELVGKRMSITEVLDLMELSAPLEKADLSEQEFSQVRDLLIKSNIRWGVDAEHRAQHGQPEIDQNTWRAGFDRLLLGHAIPSDGYQLWSHVSPLDQIEGKEVENLGRFIHYAEILFDELKDLGEARTIPAWQLRLTQLVNRLLIKGEATASQAQPIFDEFNELVEAAEAGGFQGKLQFRAIHQLLLRPFEARRPTMNLLSGGLTFSTFKPMRAVPYKVICLLGMDAGSFPRSPPGNSFDLMENRHLLGDRSAREEDRMAFLETIISARQHLLMVWTGYRASDRRELDSAGPVSELLELIRRNLRDEANKPLRKLPSPLLTHAPMQPFTPSNYRDAATRSFDQRYLLGAKRSLEGGSPLPPHWRQTLPPGDLPSSVTLEELHKFLATPAKWFSHARLTVNLEDYSPEMPDREPIELSSLEEWQVKDSLLQWALNDVAPEERRQAQLATGHLPFGAEGRALLDQAESDIGRLVEQAHHLGFYLPKRVNIALQFEGLLVEGSIGGLCEKNDQLVHIDVSPSSMKIKAILKLWLNHLALSATLRRSVTSQLICKSDIATLAPVLPQQAREILHSICNLWGFSHREPLPFFSQTAWALMEARKRELPSRAPDEPVPPKALESWRNPKPFADFDPSESNDDYIKLLFGNRYHEEDLQEPSQGSAGGVGFPFNDDAFFRVSAEILNPLYRVFHRQSLAT